MNLKTKFQKKNKIYGTWLSINNFQLCDIFSNLKVDFIGIDFEHTPTSIDDFLKFATICHSKNLKCIPRIPTLDKSLIKRLLDSGADGIIAPNIENKDQIDFLKESIFYPPKGSRGYGISKASNYGFNFENYIKKWNKEALIIIQIESIKAVKNLENLLKVNDVDGVMIGPYDISGSLGIPGKIHHPEVKKACKEVLKLCKKYKKSCGIHDTNPSSKSLRAFSKEGFNFIVVGSDIFILWRSIENINNLIKK